MNYILLLIPFFPLLGFLITGVGFKHLPRRFTSAFGVGSVFISFVLSLVLFFNMLDGEKPFTVDLFSWIEISGIHVPFSFMADQLSVIMLLVVTGVGFLIHLYSIGYMDEDEGFNRFFSYMNLFVFSMLLLVLGANYLVMFIGWEGVGLCSYLLIGFWFKNDEYNNAAKKAFIMNRIGDLGFILGIFLIYEVFGSIEYKTVFDQAANFNGCPCMISWITVLLFIGAIGKSAQIPLYTWLPDAMAGPTPVSALIHAATMVTAGVYMVARSGILYALAPSVLIFVAIIGVVTAIFSATIAIFQNDIKKILAYSTISQLGYMFLGLGVGAFTGAIFHLVTHAFFKALLFLGAGSVIHALAGEQNITKMGGLKRHLPVTFAVFIIGTLAIAGIPPLSGFFSKDEILVGAYTSNIIFWIFGVVGAMFTAFYMFRLFFLTFYGTFRGSQSQVEHISEHSKTMNISLILLAFLSLIGGFIGIPEIYGSVHHLQEFLKPVFAPVASIIQSQVPISHNTEYILVVTLLIASLASIYFAWIRFGKKEFILIPDVQRNRFIRMIQQKFYVDEFYHKVIVLPLLWLSDFGYRVIEIKWIDKSVDWIGNLTMFTGDKLRKIQTGTTGFYVLAMVLCIIALLLVNLF